MTLDSPATEPNLYERVLAKAAAQRFDAAAARRSGPELLRTLRTLTEAVTALPSAARAPEVEPALRGARALLKKCGVLQGVKTPPLDPAAAFYAGLLEALEAGFAAGVSRQQILTTVNALAAVAESKVSGRSGGD